MRILILNINQYIVLMDILVVLMPKLMYLLIRIFIVILYLKA